MRDEELECYSDKVGSCERCHAFKKINQICMSQLAAVSLHLKIHMSGDWSNTLNVLTFYLFLCHFQEQVIDEELELLVLASDGLWDVVPNDVSSHSPPLSLWFSLYSHINNFTVTPSFVQDAASLARAEDEPEAAARRLTEASFSRGSADNITCIVVRFHHDKANPANSEEAGPGSS